MHAAIIGGTRGVGRSTALSLLSTSSDNQVTLLARNPENVSSDPEFKPFVDEGRVTILKGDAYEEESLHDLVFRGKSSVDLIFFGLGATYPSGRRQFSIWGGFLLPSPDVCTRAMVSLLRVLAAAKGQNLPRLVVISVIGVGESYYSMPLMHKMILPWLLQATIDDKRGVEALVSRASSSDTIYNPEPTMPDIQVLSPENLQSIQERFLPEVIILRPSRLTDHDAEAGRLLQVGEAVTVSETGRGEIAHWVAEEAGKVEWVNRKLIIGV